MNTEPLVPFPETTHAGFVGILGRPNVGKSTLLNQLLGEKLAIASPRPQTTRQRLLGVLNAGAYQLALVDTPGLHRPEGQGRTLLNKYMVDESLQALDEVDVVLLVVDVRTLENEIVSSELDAADRYVAQQLPKNKPVILAINKVDTLKDKQRLLPLLEAWKKVYPFQVMIPISALQGEGVDALLQALCAALPAGPALFDHDTLTNQSERFLVAERIREQVFLATEKEVPYSVAVTIDQWEENISEEGPKAGQRVGVRIDATIHVEKPAHKQILVGRAGQMIRHIGTLARAEIKQLLGCGIQLFLFVRVDEDWSQRPRALKEMGYE